MWKSLVHFGWFSRNLLLFFCACQVNLRLLRPLNGKFEMVSLEFQPEGLQWSQIRQVSLQIPSWGSGVYNCFSQLKMLWFKQLWYNLHCAKWSASRFFWVSPVTHLPRHSAAFWAAGLGMVKPIWRKGAPQHLCSLETLSWRNTPSYSSSPLLILVQPWGS